MSSPVEFSRRNAQQKQVEDLLTDCNLQQYIGLFVEEGFDRMESLLEITEYDLSQMGVKRGHRRLLQRAIANTKGYPASAPLVIEPGYTPSHDVRPTCSVLGAHGTQSSMSSAEDEAVTSDNVASHWKRSYRRHAKPDRNAPVKPLSAYVRFSNKVREELKDQNMSFTEISKTAGDRWKHLDKAERDKYISDAERDKREYELTCKAYQQTEEYRCYQQYLSNFKAQHEAARRLVGKPRKRRRRDLADPPSRDTSTTPQSPTPPGPLFSSSPIPSPPARSYEQRNNIYKLLNTDQDHCSTAPPPHESDRSYEG